MGHLGEALLDPDILLRGQATLGARVHLPDDELLRAQLDRLDRRVRQAETERRRVADLYQMEAIELSEFRRRRLSTIRSTVMVSPSTT